MRNNIARKARLFEMMKKSTLICLCGLGYAFVVRVTGIAIPCPLHAVTGLYCPGCGITRMCLALLRLDLHGAWQANAMMLLLLPWLAAVLCSWAVRYIKTGQKNLTRAQNIIIWSCCVLLLLFGILRNIPMFAFWAP